MISENEEKQVRAKVLPLLRKINRSAQHYWVNPPDKGDQNWRAGWLDSLHRPKVWFLESAANSDELIKKLEKVILSK